MSVGQEPRWFDPRCAHYDPHGCSDWLNRAGHVCQGCLSRPEWQHRAVLVYTVVDDSLSPTNPLGDAVETFIRREDAEHSSRRFAATSRSSRATCGSRSGSSRRATRRTDEAPGVHGGQFAACQAARSKATTLATAPHILCQKAHNRSRPDAGLRVGGRGLQQPIPRFQRPVSPSRTSRPLGASRLANHRHSSASSASFPGVRGSRPSSHSSPASTRPS